MNETAGEQTQPRRNERAAREALRATGIDGTLEPLSQGNRKETYLCHREDDLVVQTSDDPRALATEATLLDQLARRTTVPVPTVRASGTVDGSAYLVTDRAAGTNLHERFCDLPTATQNRLAGTFGRHLASVHEQFRFDAVGELTVRDGRLVPAAETDWRSWLESYATAAVERLPAAFEDIRPALRAAVEAPAVQSAPTPRLFPWDFRPGNALARDGELTAILDWEAPLAAGPALSVAKAEYLVAAWYVDDPVVLKRSFRAGYETARPWPSVKPAHRVAAIASSAVDSRGTVTNPSYPELDREASIQFHRDALLEAL